MGYGRVTSSSRESGKRFLFFFLFWFSTFVFRGFVSQSTAYRRARSEAASRRIYLARWIPRLHWLSNKRGVISKDLFKSMLGIAHGMKVLPFRQNMFWVPKLSSVVTCLPFLFLIYFVPKLLMVFSLSCPLRTAPVWEFLSLFNGVRNPLKPSPIGLRRIIWTCHLMLRYCQSANIYPVKCCFFGWVDCCSPTTATARRLFGLREHDRFGSYSTPCWCGHCLAASPSAILL